MDTSRLLTEIPKKLFIAGNWVDAANGETFTVENPATGEKIAEVASATAADAKAAMTAAAEAQQAWASTSARYRATILREIFEAIEENRNHLATLMTLEMGKPLAEANGEVTYGGEYFRFYSEEATRIFGRYSHTPEGNLEMVVHRRPVGPCLFVTPWNFPLAMATRKIAPALAAGCTAIVKPARLTPLTTMYLTKLIEQVGLMPGVLNVLPAKSASEVCEPILEDPRLRKISFTGSTQVGKKLLAKASHNVLRTSMELGGNAPFLVFADADIDAAVEGAYQAKFRNGGEACTAANRIIVDEKISAEFIEKFSTKVSKMKLGNGLDEGVNIGPMIEAAAVEKLTDLVTDACNRGAKICCGGEAVPGAGYFYQPTVLANVPTEAKIFREEIFGPVAPVFTFSSEEEAIRMANDTEYGLAAYVYTSSLERITRIPDQLEYGLLGINAGVISNAAAPFGGVKHSGLGREGGSEGMLEYTEYQYVALPR